MDKLPKRDEFVTTPEFNKFSSTIFDEWFGTIFDEKLILAKFATETDIN